MIHRKLLKILVLLYITIRVNSSLTPQETNYGIMSIADAGVEERPALFIKNDLLKRIDKRQTPRKKEESADVMVQNILKWLQTIYGQSNRKIRQGAREYLPPINTEKPRPFQTGGPYSPAGSVRPSPAFPTENGYEATFSPGPTEGPTAPSSTLTVPVVPSGPTGPVTVDLNPTINGNDGAAGDNNDIYTPPDVSPPAPTAIDNNNFVQTTYATESPPVQPATSPGGGDDLNHPPHIHAIDVQCSKEQMTVNIEFNREYNGIIYSKGHYNEEACQYVKENSGQTKYTFTLSLNTCGTEFISAFETEGQSYLENVLVLQNEPGIQEVWDSIKTVRCLWEGNVNQALSIALSVGMLSQEIVTFSGDTAMARLDIQVGRGPFAPAANGLVKIGEIMTLVVSVSGDPDFDIQVKECKAHDESGQNSIQLTDSNGCVLKPKLFGAFQKTRETQNTGASIIAYAFFSAFKFPDVMDLTIECNIELCKTDCQVCPDPNQKIDPGKKRRRRRDTHVLENKYSNVSDESIADPVKLTHKLQVILPEDVLGEQFENTILKLQTEQVMNSICLSVNEFFFLFLTLVSLLIGSAIFSANVWLKYQRIKSKF